MVNTLITSLLSLTCRTHRPFPSLHHSRHRLISSYRTQPFVLSSSRNRGAVAPWDRREDATLPSLCCCRCVQTQRRWRGGPRAAMRPLPASRGPAPSATAAPRGGVPRVLSRTCGRLYGGGARSRPTDRDVCTGANWYGIDDHGHIQRWLDESRDRWESRVDPHRFLDRDRRSLNSLA